MRALINNESVFRDIFRSHIIASQNIDHFRRFVTDFLLRKTQVKRTRAGSLTMKHVETVPAQSFIDYIARVTDLFHFFQKCFSIVSLEQMVSDHDHRHLSLLESIGKRMLATGDFRQHRRTAAQMHVLISEILC